MATPRSRRDGERLRWSLAQVDLTKNRTLIKLYLFFWDDCIWKRWVVLETKWQFPKVGLLSQMTLFPLRICNGFLCSDVMFEIPISGPRTNCSTTFLNNSWPKPTSSSLKPWLTKPHHTSLFLLSFSSDRKAFSNFSTQSDHIPSRFIFSVSPSTKPFLAILVTAGQFVPWILIILQSVQRIIPNSPNFHFFHLWLESSFLLPSQ